MMRAVLICWFVSTLDAQQAGEGLLAEVRAKVVDNVGRLLNYMCTETVERTTYVLHSGSEESCAGLLPAKGQGRLVSSDRVRLDVGSSKSNEFYSWAGENRFYDKTPREIVGNGATSNGSFTALLAMIFMTDPVKFTYVGEHQEGQRSLAEFAYEANLTGSHYTYLNNHFRVYSAYEGTFLADPKTFDCKSSRG